MKQKQEKRVRTLGKILFFMYMIFVVYFLIFSELYGRQGEMSDYHYNLVLFQEITRFIRYREQLGFFAVFTNIVGNIMIFVPFGVFLPMASEKKSFIHTMICSFLFSLGVEVFQLITKVGCFDVDDLLLNTIGGIIGYTLFRICGKIRRRHAIRQKYR